jgi:hypothetical protein
MIGTRKKEKKKVAYASYNCFSYSTHFILSEEIYSPFYIHLSFCVSLRLFMAALIYCLITYDLQLYSVELSLLFYTYILSTSI